MFVAVVCLSVCFLGFVLFVRPFVCCLLLFVVCLFVRLFVVCSFVCLLFVCPFYTPGSGRSSDAGAAGERDC